ncbi:hypothetical protein Vretimale_9170 [Volvox reticuliferus]|uniref:Thioredoxin domain-containing protein n=1 Tax=Volvox reticuliferus TaxID=1737510 RepID=A0A8J4FM23_9CHLO|nr:hypothetical protein Vretifemale_10038 [Volvox reticuliferus]GIM04626.1 hypothetical protein Vretimale_9170 [Volvox reticuliferus]
MAAVDALVKDVASPQDLQVALTGGKPVLLHFWASWCEPCKQMDVVLAQLAADLPDITCMRIEAEAVDDVTIQYSVTTVPYFIFLRGGEVVDRLEGADPPALTAKATALARGGVVATSSSSVATSAKAAGAVAGSGGAAGTGGGGVFGRIKYLLSTWPVVVFMKGSSEAPRCGFSGRVVEALNKLGVAFKSVDILQDEELRQGLKEYSNWPTYPQLYVKGELVGGCDIVTEMTGTGELEALFRDKLGPEYKTVTAAAAAGAAPAGAAVEAAPPAAAVPAAGTPIAASTATAESAESVRERIKALLNGPHPVMLFMKGTPEVPRCGFSRRVVEALQAEDLEFGSFDILQDEVIRQGLKEYSNWPTYPQLYVRGELVGGCDIVTEMRANGELGSTIREMAHRMDVP